MALAEFKISKLLDPLKSTITYKATSPVGPRKRGCSQKVFGGLRCFLYKRKCAGLVLYKKCAFQQCLLSFYTVRTLFSLYSIYELSSNITELHAKYKIIVAKMYVIEHNDNVRAWKLVRPKNTIDNPTDFEII